MLKRILSAALLAAIVACAGDPGLSEEPSYAAGYGDGCATAHEHEKSFSTKRVKDDNLFESDRAYRVGWRQGYLQCQPPHRKFDDGGRILGDEEGF